MTGSSQPQELKNLVARSLAARYPKAPSVSADPRPISGIETVVFDVYGTLLTSGLGDTSSSDAGRLEAFQHIIDSFFLEQVATPPYLRDLYDSAIANSHRLSRTNGIDHPEVEIRRIWRTVMSQLPVNRYPPADQIAMEYELHANPSWPMPGVVDILRWLRVHGYKLAIVSNAQFYTPIILEVLFGCSVADLGFQACVWSFQEGEAKPSAQLFYRLWERLPDFKPERSLYVGNDMLNDIHTASSIGMRTVLFAGDDSSLRLRKENPALERTEPDAVITGMEQLKLVLTGDMT